MRPHGVYYTRPYYFAASYACADIRVGVLVDLNKKKNDHWQLLLFKTLLNAKWVETISYVLVHGNNPPQRAI